MSNMIIVEDANGVYRPVKEEDLCQHIKSLFGMSLPSIEALLAEYERRNGPIPMTPESVRSTFKEKQ